jgi:hypothetical protein
MLGYLQARILRRWCSMTKKPYHRHGEEIECSDSLTVILEEGQPLLTGVTAPHHATQISTVRSATVKPSLCSSA